ncbi:tRNA lysidine(34) synthetase TilS [Cryomorphaceae bacterium]|nr:tRNA lysidine(34) synthetase TilS [Cryomorphaceae bacterium]
MKPLNKVISDWAEANLAPTARCLVAVSGGVDSMTLVHLLHSAGVDLSLAHANFQLRGDESAADEAFVQQYAQEAGIPLHWRRFSPEELEDQSDESVQMWARRKRYDWFAEVMREEGFDHLLTAHHRDDQLETIWWNMIRGTGVSGLRGILAEQEFAGAERGLLRPLLTVGKDEILAYAEESGVAFRTDSSNASLKYRRNVIRHNIVPQALDIQPALSANITDFASRMRDLEHLLADAVGEVRKAAFSEKEHWTEVRMAPIQDRAGSATLWHELLRPYGFTALGDILRAIDEKTVGARFFSPKYRLTMDREHLVIDRRADEEQSTYTWYEGEALNDPIVLRGELKERRLVDIPTSPLRAALDYDKLSFPLTLRRWRAGDAFKPLGMSGTKKLQDYFTDEKWSRTAKENAWLLCSGDDIIWLVGHRLDDRYKIGDATEKVYLVALLENEM